MKRAYLFAFFVVVEGLEAVVTKVKVRLWKSAIVEDNPLAEAQRAHLTLYLLHTLHCSVLWVATGKLNIRSQKLDVREGEQVFAVVGVHVQIRKS